RIGKYVRFTQDVLKEIISAGHLLPRLFAGGDDFLQVILSKANILADPSIRDRVPPGSLVEPTDRNSEDFGRFLDGEQAHRVIGGGGHWHWFIFVRSNGLPLTIWQCRGTAPLIHSSSQFDQVEFGVLLQAISIVYSVAVISVTSLCWEPCAIFRQIGSPSGLSRRRSRVRAPSSPPFLFNVFPIFP